jgi:peptidoglycan L-alanyl-D-glutamate endopeptidase CwlK
MSLVALLLAYLFIVSAAVTLALVPAWRDAAWGWTRRRGARMGQRVHRAAAIVARDTSAVARGVPVRTMRRVRAWGPRQWAGVGALCVALIGPPLIAFWLGAGRWLDSYDDARARRADPQITALLQGEQLVPPAPLPPEVFATREVQAERPMLDSASREWSALDADFRQRLLLVFKLMRERYGYDMALLEGYRSPERQAMLFSRGLQVTRAGANQSYHQFGLAADCAFYRDGKLVISEKDPWAMRGYQLYGELAEAAGLRWGGRWTTLMDFGHVELPRANVLQAK